MSLFDYNAPAELFLAKRAKGCRDKYSASRQRLRPSVMPLRTFARPEPSAHGLRSGMSASTVAKFNAYTKPMTIRCASLSDRARARTSSQRD